MINHVLDAVADVPDGRDQLYQPSLRPLRSSSVPWKETPTPDWWSSNRVRDQKNEPSCVGHALAAVIDHMRAVALTEQSLTPAVKATLDKPYVSADMLYNLARFHDEWATEEYAGSSIRGGLKGFFYNGVCSDELVKKESKEHAPRKRDPRPSWLMTRELGANARNIQLGAYYRIRPRLPDMHGALNEAKALIVSAYIHQGWERPSGSEVTIAYDSQASHRPDKQARMHAFAVVGYDADAFWVQNSWGKGWGQGGLARWLYTDWAANVVDAWVLALAVLAQDQNKEHGGSRLTAYGSRIERSETHFLSRTPTDFSGPSRLDVIGHLVPFRDGKLDRYGPYNTNRQTLQATVDLIAGRYTDTAAARHGVNCAEPGVRISREERRYRHVLIYFLGGWPDEDRLATDVAAVAPAFRDLGIYPFFLAWDTPMFLELNRIIRHAIENVAMFAQGVSLARRVERDRRIEGMIALPGNRLLRDLRQSARRMFRLDQPDPDLDDVPAGRSRQSTWGETSYCLHRLFTDLAPHYRDGDIEFHVAAHGFGAQLLVECLAHEELIRPAAVFKTATLISPLVASHRVGHLGGKRRPDAAPTLFDVVLARGEKLSRRPMDCLAIEQLRIISIAQQSLRMDRFSDDYGNSWPELAAFVMGLDPELQKLAKSGAREEPKPAKSLDNDDPRRNHKRLPLLGLPGELEAFGRAARQLRLDVEIDLVTSQEDVVDSSLHHELGFHPTVLDQICHTVLGKSDKSQHPSAMFNGAGRRILMKPLDLATPA